MWPSGSAAAHRGREAPVVRRAHRVVPDVRHEHAPGAADVGGVPGVLGPHVPQKFWRTTKRDSRCVGPCALPETLVCPMDSGHAVHPAAADLVAPLMVWLCVGLYDEPVRDCSATSGPAATSGCTAGSATPSGWRSRCCRPGCESIRGPGPDWIGPAAACRMMPRCRRRRRGTCRRSTNGTSPPTTARSQVFSRTACG